MTMTPQQIFDTVAKHLLTQNAKALDPDYGGLCLYRAPDGKRCAVGALIPDELYHPAMEQNALYELLDQYPQLEDHFGSENVELLGHLQHIHDRNAPSQWREQRITARIEPDGTVLFHDHSRMIAGRLQVKHRPLTVEVRTVAELVMHHYDRGNYDQYPREAMNLTWDPTHEHLFRIQGNLPLPHSISFGPA